MADLDRINRSKVFEGPTIAGKRTITNIFSTTELRRSDFLPSLLNVTNTAYHASESSIPQLGMNVQDRLRNIEHFFADLRDDPESFTVIVSYPGSSTVMGTASVRRSVAPSQTDTSPWRRRLKAPPDTEEWELKLMSTDPAAQGCGVATFMVSLTEREIVRRFEEKSELAVVGSSARRVRMVLCTPAELYESFYHRRGYTTDYQNARGDGFNFYIVFMSKLLHETSGSTLSGDPSSARV